jgi:hypothetical protein
MFSGAKQQFVKYATAGMFNRSAASQLDGQLSDRRAHF